MSAVRPAPQSLWSAQQQAWLSALGHTIYLTGAPVAAAEEVPAQEGHAGSTQPAAPGGRPPPAQARTAPRVPPRPVDVAPSRPAPPPRAGSRLPDRLHFALIRASGCNPNAPESAAIIAGWPPSSELRGNPAAKRALWPSLRALRRQQAGS
ncbi:alanine acetyltransferase [Pseudoxanthomonas mexicana]|uniref:alanine acetyltransferase n=1 Tax=Pseudoxanthomonas mexicana TaxID=128785 RepID=UPI00398B09F0